MVSMVIPMVEEKVSKMIPMIISCSNGDTNERENGFVGERDFIPHSIPHNMWDAGGSQWTVSDNECLKSVLNKGINGYYRI